MRRMIYTGTPSAQDFNRLADAIDGCGKGIVTYSGGTGAPKIVKLLLYSWIRLEEDWAAYDYQDGYGVWHSSWSLLRGATYHNGLLYSQIRTGYELIADARYDARKTIYDGGTLPVETGYGTINQDNSTVDDIAAPGAMPANDLGCTWCPVHTEIDSEPTGGTVPGKFVYANDGYLDSGATEMIIPDGDSAVDNLGRPENWFSGGHAGAVLNYDRVGTYYHASYWRGIEDSGGVRLLHGQYWVCGVEGVGRLDNWPVGDWGIDPATYGFNWIGGVPMDQVDPDWHWDTKAWIVCNASAAFTLPRVLQSIDDGATINEALIEIKIDDLVQYQASVATTVDDEGNPTTTHDIVQTTDSINIVLIGGQIVDTATGQMRWDVLAQAGTSTAAEPDKWAVYDITAIVQEMIDTWRSSKYTRFALVPGPYVDGLTHLDNVDSYIAALAPTVTWSVWQNPLQSGTYRQAGDFDYISSSSGSYIEWGGISIGSGYVDFTLPSGVSTRVRLPGNMPADAPVGD